MSGIRLALLVFCVSSLSWGISWDLSSDFNAQSRYFPVTGAFPVQTNLDYSFAVQPKFTVKSANARQTFDASVFFRWDAMDTRRTHFDISELTYVHAWTNFELKVGVRKIFWGVTESQHLVDIVNQFDIVEDFRAYTKLGQPMVSGALVTDAGTFELLVMPYFRDRTFPGEKGRFRDVYLVNPDRVTFESSLGRWNPDVALRWAHHIGAFDLGVSHFYGTNRAPDFSVVSAAAPVLNELAVRYPLIQQTGLDLQFSHSGFMGKLELLARGDKAYQNAYVASTIGGEYTFNNVWGPVDIGVLVEYLVDSRGSRATSPFQNDVYAGLRIAHNEKNAFEFLFGGIVDLQDQTTIVLGETSRKFGPDFKAALKAGIFLINSLSDPFSAFSKDHFVQLDLTYYWAD